VTIEQSSRSVADGSGGVEVAGVTDRGTFRTENQDAWEVVTRAAGTYALLLADGMGGHPGGRESAEAAIEAATARLSEPGDADALLRMAMHEANAGVAGVRNLMGGDPGTTLVLAVVADGQAVVANIGDSRAYLIRAGGATQITDDHSWVGEQVREGKLEPAAARGHARRNVITRAVMGDPVEPDLFPVALQPGDTLLLCSDGVWEPLSDEMLAELLTDGGPLIRDLERMCDAALDAGGRDNVTVVAARLP
jgi:serine/threonine protein phosphatase PrpC